MKEPDPSLNSGDTPPESDRDLLVAKEDDEKTQATVDSFVDDASLSQPIHQARLAPFASTSSTTSKDSVKDPTSIWSGCTGCTGDDTLSFTHVYKVFSEEIEYLRAGQRGGCCLANKVMLPYVCWPNGNDSDYSSIAKDDISDSSSVVSSGKNENDASSKGSSGTKDVDSTALKANDKEDTVIVSQKEAGLEVYDKASPEMKRNHIFSWRSSSNNGGDGARPTHLAAESIAAPADLGLLDGSQASEQGHVLEGLTTPSSLQIPLLVETIGPSESHMGIEAEDLSDDDSKDGSEIESPPETHPVPRDTESSTSDTKSRSSTSIFGKMKSVISKGSSRRSLASRSSESASVALVSKEVDSVAASRQSSLSRLSKTQSLALESSEAESVTYRRSVAKLVVVPPKNVETESIASRRIVTSENSKVEPSELKQGDDIYVVSNSSDEVEPVAPPESRETVHVSQTMDVKEEVSLLVSELKEMLDVKDIGPTSPLETNENNEGSEVQHSVSKVSIHEKGSEDKSVDGLLEEHSTTIPTPSLVVCDVTDELQASMEKSSPEDSPASQGGLLKPSLLARVKRSFAMNRGKASHRSFDTTASGKPKEGTYDDESNIKLVPSVDQRLSHEDSFDLLMNEDSAECMSTEKVDTSIIDIKNQSTGASESDEMDVSTPDNACELTTPKLTEDVAESPTAKHGTHEPSPDDNTMVSDNANIDSVLGPIVFERVRRSFAAMSEFIDDLANGTEQNEDEIQNVGDIAVEASERQHDIPTEEDDIEVKDPVLDDKSTSIEVADSGFSVPHENDQEEMKVDEVEPAKLATAEPLIKDIDYTNATLPESESPSIKDTDGFASDEDPPKVTDTTKQDDTNATLPESESPSIEDADGFEVDEDPLVVGETRRSQYWLGTFAQAKDPSINEPLCASSPIANSGSSESHGEGVSISDATAVTSNTRVETSLEDIRSRPSILDRVKRSVGTSDRSIDTKGSASSSQLSCNNATEAIDSKASGLQDPVEAQKEKTSVPCKLVVDKTEGETKETASENEDSNLTSMNEETQSTKSVSANESTSFPINCLSTKKQERITKIKQMIEEDSEPLSDDDELESDTSIDSPEKVEEGIGRIAVATEEIVQSKTKEKLTSSGLPPSGRKSKKRWSKIKKSIHKLSKSKV